MKNLFVALALVTALTFGAGMLESFTGLDMTEDAQAGRIWNGKIQGPK